MIYIFGELKVIRVSLLELDKHRNETSFRYYVVNQNLFKEVGIEFTTSDSYDYAMVGHKYNRQKITIK